MAASDQALFLTMLSQLPHGIWYSYNSVMHDTRRRVGPIFSVAKALGITQKDVDMGTMDCDNLRHLSCPTYVRLNSRDSPGRIYTEKYERDAVFFKKVK